MPPAVSAPDGRLATLRALERTFPSTVHHPLMHVLGAMVREALEYERQSRRGMV